MDSRPSIPAINPKPKVIYLQREQPFMEEPIKGRRLTKYDESDGGEWRFHRLQEPYVDHSMCKPMGSWQLTLHPTCNIFHEVDILFHSAEFFGRGGWRIAWKLRSGKGDDSLILKTLRWDNQNFDKLTFQRHKVDAIIAEHLTSSRFIVDIYGFCGQSALNEFADGSLTAWIRDSTKHSLTSLQKLQLSLDIATGIANMHDISGKDNATIVHNDLKPDNIVIVNGRAKLNDFNDGELLRWNQSTQSHCGFRRNPVEPWVRYRAPEQARKNELLNEKVDVFALGSILLYVLTGKKPFAGESMSDTKQKLRENISPPISLDYRKSDDPADIAITKAINDCHETEVTKRISAEKVSSELRKIW
eukprot:CAMPEP_0196821732 /NCGR_PEP_ID=MMETSP1362-20130617/80672_1 /TAXON_ID=163516 /ORGANISM="Leptocylindrus danicus, Strain CCMP1856" /LENGTH=359 /DNA_ID=CAMNT_0042201047 /DNA_START=578 /DNA_END=1654 /DNA_ORIENTATION=-